MLTKDSLRTSCWGLRVASTMIQSSGCGQQYGHCPSSGLNLCRGRWPNGGLGCHHGHHPANGVGRWCSPLVTASPTSVVAFAWLSMT
jgi:hypothetical protein